jgi:hypothetical protein
LVFLFRGAEQSATGKIRRKKDDRSNYHRLGRHLDCDDVRQDSRYVLRFPLSPGCFRSGVFSRHYSLPHLLVSVAAPRQGFRDVHVPLFFRWCHWGAHGGCNSESFERCSRLGALAVALPYRRNPFCDSRRPHVVLSHRQTRKGRVAETPRKSTCSGKTCRRIT